MNVKIRKGYMGGIRSSMVKLVGVEPNFVVLRSKLDIQWGVMLPLDKLL